MLWIFIPKNLDFKGILMIKLKLIVQCLQYLNFQSRRIGGPFQWNLFSHSFFTPSGEILNYKYL